jgi:hypothetical protein
MNTPDRWVVIEVISGDTHLYRVFGCWYGGYAGSDSWQMNSGIVGVDEEKQYYDFHGASGSVYRCYKHNYGSHLYGASVLNNLIAKAKEQGTTINIMPEETNWKELVCTAQ